MRLATTSAVKIGLTTIGLHPSLRAATYLERRHGGFDQLLSAISDGNLGVIVEVIEISGDRTDPIAAIGNTPLIEIMPGLIEGVAKHVLCVAGIDVDTPKRTNAGEGERITFDEYHTKLYRIATGWLGWSPDQAWNATSAEILEAYNGHLEKLRALNGVAEPEKSTPDSGALNRAGLHGLKTLGGTA